MIIKKTMNPARPHNLKHVCNVANNYILLGSTSTHAAIII